MAVSKRILPFLFAIALACPGGAAASTPAPRQQAATPASLAWMGHTWRITNGGMAGVAKGRPDNVRVDSHGYLHLRIAKHDGAWTAAELMSLDRLGFGTYQWQVEGNIYHMDKSTVLGLFLYGPAAHIGVDGQNEIDVAEFSQWNGTCHCDADFTIFFPPPEHPGASTKNSWGDNFLVTGGKLTTIRMRWTSSGIVFTVMKGLEPLGTTVHVLKTDTYRSDAAHIPQVPLPLAMNLWCFKSTPSKSQEVVIRSFQFQPESQAQTADGEPSPMALTPAKTQ